jgi:hypothetical protein
VVIVVAIGREKDPVVVGVSDAKASGDDKCQNERAKERACSKQAELHAEEITVAGRRARAAGAAPPTDSSAFPGC